MKTYLRFLIAPAVFVGVGFFLHAQDGDKGQVKGKVLLLKTGHAMEGDIEKVGTQLCIRRGKSEVWIGEDKAIRLCADWDDAYAYAQTQIKLDDANDRVKLARWCHMHRLTERALDQARAALELQPQNADAKQIVTLLERALKEPPAKPAPRAPAAAARPVEPAPTVDVSFESLVAFSTKVQPILMNRCTACHASAAAGGKFHLDRVSDSGQKASTHRNLAAVLTHLDLDRPAISPFLVKAITPHGDAQTAPIKDRTAKPMQTMQQWVEQTVAKNPQLKDYRAKKQPPGKAQPEPKSVFPMQRSLAPAQGDNVVSQPVPRLEIDEKNPPRVLPAHEARLPMSLTPVDEFDAVIFNAWAHPRYFQQQAASNR
jgi:hypothetical protein